MCWQLIQWIRRACWCWGLWGFGVSASHSCRHDRCQRSPNPTELSLAWITADRDPTITFWVSSVRPSRSLSRTISPTLLLAVSSSSPPRFLHSVPYRSWCDSLRWLVLLWGSTSEMAVSAWTSLRPVFRVSPVASTWHGCSWPFILGWYRGATAMAADATLHKLAGAVASTSWRWRQDATRCFHQQCERGGLSQERNGQGNHVIIKRRFNKAMDRSPRTYGWDVFRNPLGLKLNKRINRWLWLVQSDLQTTSIRSRCSASPYTSENLSTLLAYSCRADLWPFTRCAVARNPHLAWFARPTDTRHSSECFIANIISKPKDADPRQSCATRSSSTHGGVGRGVNENGSIFGWLDTFGCRDDRLVAGSWMSGIPVLLSQPSILRSSNCHWSPCSRRSWTPIWPTSL